MMLITNAVTDLYYQPLWHASVTMAMDSDWVLIMMHKQLASKTIYKCFFED